MVVEHRQGRQDRSYTSEQHSAVKRVMRCTVTDYYGILDLKKPSGEAEIRKAYRRLALVMHPDKNGAPQSDEAFKRVSKAFQILSDADKRAYYEQTGSDPEVRGGGDPGASFAQQFGRHQFGQTQFADPNDIFNMFFGQGMAGGPNVHTFSFGGPQGNAFEFGNNFFNEAFFGPQRRQQPRPNPRRTGQNENQSSWVTFLSLVPVLLMLLLSVLGKVWDSFGDTGPRFRFEKAAPYTSQRFTRQYKVPFYVNGKETEQLSRSKLRQLDQEAETYYISGLRQECNAEFTHRAQRMRDADGFFFRDQAAYDEARRMPLPHCARLDSMGVEYKLL